MLDNKYKLKSRENHLGVYHCNASFSENHYPLYFLRERDVITVRDELSQETLPTGQKLWIQLKSTEQ